jgi:hypothetical protein
MALVSTLPLSDADLRWQNWQARGAKADRRMATRMRRVVIVLATGLAVWFVVQLG